MIKFVKTLGDRRHLLVAKIECSKIFPVPKEKIGQYHKNKQTITMEKVKETVNSLLKEKLKPILNIQNHTKTQKIDCTEWSMRKFNRFINKILKENKHERKKTN